MFGRLGRLVLKELREILRDRRTIITLVVMPLVIYPLLAIAFQRFLFTSIAVQSDVSYMIAVDSQPAQRALFDQLHAGSARLSKQAEATGAQEQVGPPTAERVIKNLTGTRAAPEVSIIVLADIDIKRQVENSFVHVAALQKRSPASESEKGLRTPVTWELFYRAGSPSSEAALHFVESRLQAYNDFELNQQLQKLGVEATMPAATIRVPIEYSGAPVFSLAALIPLVLVLMTVTGAVYPAIDLTAGERERGTLETLIAAPVPRIGLLVAKYVAVLTVAMLTALVNLICMTITAQTTGLAATLFGGGMSLAVVLKVLVLLGLFAAFFSAILLAVTSYARSFKEAQAYIIPLMLLCLVPGVLCLMPTLQFQGWMAVTPLVNIVMLARELLEGTAVTSLAVAAVCSTIFYIGAAIAIAARIFGTDAILYGSQATWSDFVRRPEEPQPAASIPAAMLCLALMFPSYFVMAGGLGRSLELPMDQRLVIGALVTIAVCGGIPAAIALFGRVRASGLGLRKADGVAYLAAGILGAAAWPIAIETFLLGEWLGLSALDKQQIALAESMLGEFPSVPIWLLLTSFGLVPAIVEEFCFRGFLFGALRTALAGWVTVLVTAALFGVFHELLFPGRLLTTMLLGVLLGWLRLRTASVYPGMLLHALHNCLLLSIAYYRNALVARGWGVEEQAHLPITWLVASAVAVTVGGSLLMAATRKSELPCSKRVL
jgi:ABC-2 type transport system permease protein/sodium transport system permease protein